MGNITEGIASNAGSQSELQDLLQGKKAQNNGLRSILSRVKQVNAKYFGEEPAKENVQQSLCATSEKPPLRSELFGENELSFHLLEEIAREFNKVESIF